MSVRRVTKLASDHTYLDSFVATTPILIGSCVSSQLAGLSRPEAFSSRAVVDRELSSSMKDFRPEDAMSCPDRS